MRICNARLRGEQGYYTVECVDGLFSNINKQDEYMNKHDMDIDAKGNLLCAPFVEPHIHLDAALTAGEPNWNMSGTLFEGIERWAERKPLLSSEDVKRRVIKTVQMLVENGIGYVRTHVDITDPDLTALKAIIELRDGVLAPYVDLQIVAFPQEGVLSFPDGKMLLERAVQLGADVIGGIPHFEYTREHGVESLNFIIDLAEKYQKLVDIHCDEIDDGASRFLETLATRALERGMGERVTASHTTAMASYNNAYCYKLFRLLKRSKINFISCPTESIHLQGRFDSYPKIRGITRVKELRDAGMNVCFAQDSIQDPWYSLGNGKLLRVLDTGLHCCHMMGYEDLQNGLDLITDNGAKVLHIENEYGIEIGKPANFIILQGGSDVEAIQRQGEVLWSVRKGEVLLKRKPAKMEQCVKIAPDNI